jgi:hypothetical protein
VQPKEITCGYDETTGNCTKQNCCRAPEPTRASLRHDQSLTDEQIEVIEADVWNLKSMDDTEREANKEFARAIEHAVKGLI